MLQHLTALIALAALAVPGRAQTTATFMSNGNRVRVACFEPKDRGPRPAVVLLHGMDGPDGRHYVAVARQLASKGYVTFLVRYHDATGTRPEELPGLCKQFQASLSSSRMPSSLRAMFLGWRDAARDAVAYARKHPRVDASRVGLVGLSAGGFLATSVAADPGSSVRCVVELFGGLPREQATGLKAMPPTLIVHGDRDDVVPAAEAHALAGLLRDRRLPFELKVYEGAGHCFVGRKGELDWFAAGDAQLLSLSFLNKHLNTPVVAAR